MSKPERRYCVTSRELLAVGTFTRQYRPYLMGRRFLLRTDHGSLTWLRNFREVAGQLARLLQRLQELDFEIVHRRGKKHINADALSRFPCQQCGRDNHDLEAEKQVSAVKVCRSDPPPIHKLREVQLADSTLGRILRGKEAGEKLAAEEMERASRSSCRLLQLWDQLLVHDGILCRRFEPPDLPSTPACQDSTILLFSVSVLTQILQGSSSSVSLALL